MKEKAIGVCTTLCSVEISIISTDRQQSNIYFSVWKQKKCSEKFCLFSPNGSVIGNKLFTDWLDWDLIPTKWSPDGWFPVRFDGVFSLICSSFVSSKHRLGSGTTYPDTNYYQLFTFHSTLGWNGPNLIASDCVHGRRPGPVVFIHFGSFSPNDWLDYINLITALDDRRTESWIKQLFVLCFWLCVLQKPVMTQNSWSGGWVSCDGRHSLSANHNMGPLMPPLKRVLYFLFFKLFSYWTVYMMQNSIFCLRLERVHLYFVHFCSV